MVDAAPRRRWPVVLGTLGGLAALVVGGGVAFGAYALSPAGFRGLVLPAASRATGWTITASSGRVGLGGALWATDLVVEAPDSGLSLRVDSLQARVEPFSLASDLPVIQIAVVRGADLTLGPAPEAPDDEGPTEIRVPVRVDRLALVDGAARVHDGERTSARVGGLSARVKDLRPGATAAIALAGNLAAAPGDPTAATDAALDLSLPLTQDATGAEIAWTGTGSALVRPVAGPPPLRTETAFAVDTRGVARTDDVSGGLDLAATRGTQRVGDVQAEAAWRGGAAGSLTADVALSGLGPAFVNPLLALAAPVQMRAGTIDGHVKAATAGADVGLDALLTGKDISFVGTGRSASTLPVQVRAAGLGAVSWDGTRARVDTASLEVDQGGRRLATARLAEPLALALGEGAASDPSVARIGLDVDRMALTDLRPWVALSGSDPLADVSEGTLQAEILAAVAEQGRSIRATGSWQADGVVWGDLGPLGIAHDLDAVFTGFQTLAVEPRTASLSYRGKALATATPRVTWDDTSGALAVEAALQAGDGPEALRRLGVLPEWVGLRGGRLSGTAAYVVAGTGAEPAATAKLKMGPSRLVDEGGTLRGARSFDLDLVAATDAAGDELRIGRANVTIGDQGPASGLVTVTGTWPLDDAAPRGGRIDIGLRDVEAREWAEAMGYVAPGAARSLPLSGDISAIVAAGATDVALAGKETLGPFVPELGGGRQWTSTTLEVEHGGTWRGDALEGFTLALVAKQPDKPAGRADLAGRVGLGERTDVTLAGKATDFDLSPLAVLQLGPDEAASSSASASGVDLGAYFDFDVSIDLDVVVDLERCAYFDLPIDQGKLTARGKRGNLRLLLEAPKMAGGSGTLVAKLMVTGRHPGFEWSLRADDTDVGAIVKALNYGEPTLLRARGSFVSEGQGSGVKTALGRTLDGTFAFDLADGGFLDAALLDFIARETGVFAFQRMGFEIARGKVSVKKGTLALDAAEVWNVETKLAAGGLLYDRSNQEWRVNPRVDRATWEKIAPRWNVPPYLMDDGYVALPIDVTVGGTWAKPRYAVAPRSGLWEDVAGGALEAIDDRTGLDLSGAARDLFGIGDDDEEAAPAPAPAPAPTPRPPAPRPASGEAPKPLLSKPPTTSPRPK